jgi:hypothetical protein
VAILTAISQTPSAISVVIGESGVEGVVAGLTGNPLVLDIGNNVFISGFPVVSGGVTGTCELKK